MTKMEIELVARVRQFCDGAITRVELLTAIAEILREDEQKNG